MPKSVMDVPMMCGVRHLGLHGFITPVGMVT